MSSSTSSRDSKDLRVPYDLCNPMSCSLLNMRKVDRKFLSERMIVIIALDATMGFKKLGRPAKAISSWIEFHLDIKIKTLDVRKHLAALDGLVEQTNDQLESITPLRFKLIYSELRKVALVFHNGAFEMIYNTTPLLPQMDMSQSKAVDCFAPFPKPHSNATLIDGALFVMTAMPVFMYPSTRRICNSMNFLDSLPPKKRRHSPISDEAPPLTSPNSSSLFVISNGAPLCPNRPLPQISDQSPSSSSRSQNVSASKGKFMINNLLSL